jgi:5-methylcytosine-specific restriction endonuclease McrA
MAKRPSRGKCVHCLTDDVDRTWDHVFPRAWYPDSTPSDLYKWQIPSCHACNRDYGSMEDDLLFRLALCVDPDTPGTAGIVDKALRSMKPELAKDKRDRAARAARAARLRGELIDGPNIERSAVYPGLGERWARPPAEAVGIRVPAKSLRRLTEKNCPTDVFPRGQHVPGQ